MDEIRLIPLGTNGYMPSFGRQTMSFLILTGESAIVLDAGTGLGRLLEPDIGAQVERYDRLNIVLSHYHLDHVIGLSYLPGVWGTKATRIFAPGPPFVDAAPDLALNRLLGPPLFPALRDFPGPVEVVPMLHSSFDIDGIPVQIRRQNHAGGSIGIRLGDALVYMTDTTAHKGPLPFLDGARLLLHETWFLEPVDTATAEKAGHSRLADVLDLAAASGVPRLMPVHFHPTVDSAAIQAIAQAAISRGVQVVIPAEGVPYSSLFSPLC